MSNTSKISPRKVVRFAGLMLLLLAFAGVLIAANYKQSDKQILGTIVTLNNPTKEENFLKKDDVEALISKQGITIANQTLASLNVDEIENIVQSNPWVKSAEVFVDNNSMLNIEVVQRLPVARVFDVSGNSFYVDSSGFEMPLSDRYAYAVPVFTNFSKIGNDSANQSAKAQLVYLSSIIKEDSFWNAQITQVEVASWNNYNFYTTLGKQKVKFGDTTMAMAKLSNLMSFYQEVSNKIGWDQYQILDVRFKGQVVASPSLGWVPPRDTVQAEAKVASVNAVIAKPVAKPAVVPVQKVEDKKEAERKLAAVKKEKEKQKQQKAKAAKKAVESKPVAKAAPKKPEAKETAQQQKAKKAAADKKRAEAEKNKKDKKK